VLDADRSDLELAFIQLQDDAIVVVSLGVDNPSQIPFIPHDPAAGTSRGRRNAVKSTLVTHCPRQLGHTAMPQ
jgi:hypothetical protein